MAAPYKTLEDQLVALNAQNRKPLFAQLAEQSDGYDTNGKAVREPRKWEQLAADQSAARAAKAAEAAEEQALLDEGQLPGRTAEELLAQTPEQPDWIIPGIIARKWTVKVAAREKVGKGTFITNMLGFVERGEPTVFGPACEPINTLILSEEPEDAMREKVAHAGLRKARLIYSHELSRLDTWKRKVDYLVNVASRGEYGLFFCDNISRASGCEDEAGTELARSAEYLSDRMRAAGVTVLFDHHHRKSGGKLEDKSRGGTALAGATDNNIEVERVGDWDSRVRRISSRGRLTATIWTRQIALSEDGRRYVTVADTDEQQTVTERHRLAVLSDAPNGLTRAEFQALAGIKTKSTATRALSELVDKGYATVDKTVRPPHYHAADEPVTANDEPAI